MWIGGVVTWAMPKGSGCWLNKTERFRGKDLDLVHFRPSVSWEVTETTYTR